MCAQRKKMKVEVCINCDSEQTVFDSVSAAYLGGAATVELCSSMHLDGLTPTEENIRTARKAFQDRPGLMVMIRPRGGDFCYSQEEIERMHQQIQIAAKSNADGIVFGVLGESTNDIAIGPLHQLVETSKEFNLKTTFHRAFDATPDPLESLEILINAGVDRILTSGTPWAEQKPATEGTANLQHLVEQANGRIELVVGGGVNAKNAGNILHGLHNKENISMHSYSGVQEKGLATITAVEKLVDTVQRIYQ
jgi:copper homeostasis protein